MNEENKEMITVGNLSVSLDDIDSIYFNHSENLAGFGEGWACGLSNETTRDFVRDLLERIQILDKSVG